MMRSFFCQKPEVKYPKIVFFPADSLFFTEPPCKNGTIFTPAADWWNLVSVMTRHEHDRAGTLD